MRYNGDDDKCGGCGCDPCMGARCPWQTNGYRPRVRRAAALALGLVTAALALSACTSDAETVSRNLSTEADQFKVVRKIVVTNTWNGEVLWEATGRCSIDIGRPDVLVLTCREDADAYKKHYLSTGGGNIAWASTQLESVDVSRYHTTIVFKPTAVVPNVDISVGAQ